MMASKDTKITSAHHAGILALAGKNATSVEIRDWLLAEHGVEVSDRTVREYLQRTAEQRGEVTKAVAREALAPLVLTDLEELEAAKKRARAIEDTATQKGELTTALKAIREQHAIIDTKLRYSGAGTGEQPGEQARESMLAKLRAALK